MTVRRLLLIAAVAWFAVTACSEPAPEPAAAPAATATPTATAAAGATEASSLPSPAASEGELHYVALGDSLASGMGGEPSYADFYREGLQRMTGRPVRLTNLGRPGWTSTQLLDALRSNDEFRSAVAQADVVTWDIGGNDIVGAVIRNSTGTCGGDDGLRCMRQTTRRFADRWDDVIDELVALRRNDDVALRTFDLYSPFIYPDARTEPILDQLDAMNDTITESAGRDGVAVAPVAEAFAGAPDPLLDDDGLHPSREGHRVIARLLLELDRPPSP